MALRYVLYIAGFPSRADRKSAKCTSSTCGGVRDMGVARPATGCMPTPAPSGQNPAAAAAAARLGYALPSEPAAAGGHQVDLARRLWLCRRRWLCHRHPRLPRLLLGRQLAPALLYPLRRLCWLLRCALLPGGALLRLLLGLHARGCGIRRGACCRRPRLSRREVHTSHVGRVVHVGAVHLHGQRRGGGGGVALKQSSTPTQP